MPDMDNKYLGFTKADLKKEVCKSNATDRDYYLAQFVILTLLVEFYDGQGITSKSREFLKLGELQNMVSEWHWKKSECRRVRTSTGKAMKMYWITEA